MLKSEHEAGVMDYVDAVNEYLEYAKNLRGFSETTLDVRRNILRRFGEDMQVKCVSQIDLELVEKYINLLSKKLHVNSVASYIVALRSFIRWLNRKGINNLPFELIDVPKRRFDHPRQPLSVPDIQALLGALRRERDRLILLMLYTSGTRISELLSIRLSDIHGTKIDVNGKGGKSRTVRIDPLVAQRLMIYITMEEVREYVFISNRGTRLSAAGYSLLLKDAAKRAGIKRSVFPHLFRHTFGAQYIENGGDIRSLQLILGHEKISTTMVYLNMSDPWINEQYNKAKPLIIKGPIDETVDKLKRIRY